MATYRYHTLDVFTAGRSGANRLAVVLDPQAGRSLRCLMAPRQPRGSFANSYGPGTLEPRRRLGLTHEH